MLDRILRIDDPRDNLEKARLGELEKYARANKVEFKQGIPAMVLRKILRGKGLVSISIPPRVLGQYQPQVSAVITAEPGVEMDAVADLAKQYEAREKPLDEMSITELRKACKTRGIPMARTDKMTELRAKLSGEQAAA